MPHTDDALTARSVETLVAACAAGARPKFVFFWGHHPRRDAVMDSSCLSQWWPCKFSVEGEQFASAEQYMMWRKALLFEDSGTAAEILGANSPGHAKALGRAVVGFDDEVWLDHRWEIVVSGSLAKFGSDPDLARYLSATAERVLVEASPVDRIWGTGIAADSEQAALPQAWPGLNLLGFALMEARARLAQTPDEPCVR